MRINADFSRRAIISGDAGTWIQSPESGVDRRMLDRIGGETARATSIVRYAPRSAFSRHVHAAGEEFLVLEGIFSDEHGDYPQGSYVRNPPGTAHSPFSDYGCRILVKLRQFDPADLQTVVIDTTEKSGWSRDDRADMESRLLHEFGTERVSMLRLQRGAEAAIDAGEGGVEWLLVSGSLRFESGDYGTESWFRFPPGDAINMAATDDCIVWQKSGHLPPRPSQGSISQ